MTARTHITVRDLRGACGRDVDLFDSMFPGGAEINAQNIDLYMAAGLKVWWLTRLIPIAARSEHETADEAAWQEKENADDAAQREKEKALDPVWNDYDKARAAAIAEYAKAATHALVIALTYDDAETTA